MTANCVHMNFSANVNVGRLTASEDDSSIVGFTADITINIYAVCMKKLRISKNKIVLV